MCRFHSPLPDMFINGNPHDKVSRAEVVRPGRHGRSSWQRGRVPQPWYLRRPRTCMA